MIKIDNATKRSDLHHRLVYATIKAANSKSISEVERCFDNLRYLKNMNLSIKEICDSKAIFPLQSLRQHKNPKIRTEVEVLFNSWMKTLYSNGIDSTTSNKALLPWNLKKPNTVENLKKPDEFKCFETRPIQRKKKQSSLRMKLSENPNSMAHEVGEIKLKKKKQLPLKVSKNPPALKKNSMEMLELFEIAKKSADMANAKGLLAAKAETSICVDTLSLLISYPISSTANETRQIMERLERLTKHKDRKICNSASALVHHWRQSIRDQQH